MKCTTAGCCIHNVPLDKTCCYCSVEQSINSMPVSDTNPYATDSIVSDIPEPEFEEVSHAHLGARPDMVKHPPHYTQHPSGVECIQITEHMGFNLGNALKYIWRADLKGTSDQDMKKAIWYIERELEKREKLDEKNTNSCHTEYSS